MYEWIVMSFGLKNVGANYQWAMNVIFHDLIDHIVKAYIDDIVVKSMKHEKHLKDLIHAFQKMKAHGLKNLLFSSVLLGSWQEIF